MKNKRLAIILSSVCLVGIFTFLFIFEFHSAPWYMNEMDSSHILKNCNAEGITIGIIDTGIDEKLLEEYIVVNTYNSLIIVKMYKMIAGMGPQCLA